MQLARVIGDVVATRKDPGFDSTKLLILQPISADGTNVGARRLLLVRVCLTSAIGAAPARANKSPCRPATAP